MRPTSKKVAAVFGKDGHWMPVGTFMGDRLPGGFAYVGMVEVNWRTRRQLQLTGSTLLPSARAYWAELLLARRAWLRHRHRLKVEMVMPEPSGITTSLAAIDDIVHHLLSGGITTPQFLKSRLMEAVDLHFIAAEDIREWGKEFSDEENDLYIKTFGDMRDEEIIQILRFWYRKGMCRAACPEDCWTVPEGRCRHNKPSWFLVFNMIRET